MQYPNIYSLFRAQTANYGPRPVFYTRNGEAWDIQTWRQFEEQVGDLACALLGEDLSGKPSVAILAGNIPEWSICDIAAIAAGGVGVGIYPTNSRDQCEYILRHCEAQFLFVDTLEQLEKISDIAGPLPDLKKIICLALGERTTIELVHEQKGPNVVTKEVPVVPFDTFLAAGKMGRAELLPRVEAMGLNADPDDIAIMVYTSGTTGQPKGAMLSHRYILNSVESLRRSVPILDSDVALSYLPGCHVAERISGIYNRLYNGTPVYFIDDLNRLYHRMLEIKPTVFASLPRFFEKIHARLVAENGAVDIDPQIVRDAFGGEIRLLTSGGAPLPLEVADFFARHDLPILQAYGLTENICVAFNTAVEHRFGTVGKPMPLCNVRIAADGEILVKSEMMFSGYYQEPEKTSEMFDADGWLKTGDLGALDEDGFLKITGRKKEIIVLSTGKNVAPPLIENYVKESHLVSQCFLFGDGHSYCVALITVNKAEAGDLSDREIALAVEQSVERANSRVSRSEQIKRFEILEGDFSPDRDEVTPTLKLKRPVIAQNYKDILEKLYA